MKGFTALVLGIFATLAFSWIGLAFIPNLQIGHLEPQTDEEGKDPYPAPKSGMAERGRRVYVANGCFYCHSQQVRADYAGSDIDRKWGERRSAPRDYIFERPTELGKMRMGPDLANIGHRAPAEDQNAPAGASPAAGASASPGSSPPAPASPNPPAPAAAGANAGAPGPAAQPGTNPSPAAPAPATSGKQPATPGAAPSPATPPAGSPANIAAGAKPAPGASAVGPAASPTSAATTDVGAASAPATAQVVAPPGAAATTSRQVSPSTSPAPYSSAWHHIHLYSPRTVNLDSNMPSYKFLYVKRPIGGQPSAEALALQGDEAPGEGWEVIPSFDADCLVAYLMSLDQSHALPEVKMAAAPAASPSASPAKSP